MARARWVWSAALAVACQGAPTRRPPAPRVDAARPIDAGAARDAAVVDVAADAVADAGADAGPPSTIYLNTLGVDRLRVGTTIPLRVWRRGAVDVDVTAQSTITVEDPNLGQILPGHRFHAANLGRVMLIAHVGDEEARGVVEVSARMPPGMGYVPMVRGGPGRPLIYARFSSPRTAVQRFEFAWVDGTLSFESRGRAVDFPVTVRVASGTFDPHRGPEELAAVTGQVVFDRWVQERLDGHAELMAGGRPLRFTFSFHDTDPWTLRIPPTELRPVQ